ncbi:MAG: hypothetical protein FWG57_06165 [Endomicrobia bacterium]|nr:hypothetical protein [Endomicrobiia bacterium]
MEKLIGFVVHVFENVWHKFKINPALIVTGSIILAALFLLSVMSPFPLFSTYDIIIKTALIAVAFILAKICVVTVGEMKIDSETLHIVLFQNLVNPLIFCVIFAVVFGTLVFIGVLPFMLLHLDEKFYIIVAAAASGIAAFALFPIAVLSMLFSYEGKSFSEAVFCAKEILKGRRGRMYFLTFSLILIALFLKLTYVGMLILFPLVIMVLAQARESLVKSEEEEKIEKIEVKKSYRPGFDYSQNHGVNRTLAPERKESDFIKKDSGSAEPAPFKISNGQKSVTVEIADIETEKKNSRILSAAEYEAPETEEEKLVEFMKGDILYENEKEEKIEVEVEKNDKDADEDTEKKSNEDVEHDIEIEIEKDIKDTKTEQKSGKAYLEDFGTIKRGDVKSRPNKEINKSSGNGSYLDNFGNLKKNK